MFARGDSVDFHGWFRPICSSTLGSEGRGRCPQSIHQRHPRAQVGSKPRSCGIRGARGRGVETGTPIRRGIRWDSRPPCSSVSGRHAPGASVPPDSESVAAEKPSSGPKHRLAGSRFAVADGGREPTGPPVADQGEAGPSAAPSAHLRMREDLWMARRPASCDCPSISARSSPEDPVSIPADRHESGSGRTNRLPGP